MSEQTPTGWTGRYQDHPTIERGSMSVAFADTETTGLDPDLNPIWEVAVIPPDGPDEGEHVWQVKVPELVLVSDSDPAPERPYISPWVVENTGFASRYDRGQALTPKQSIYRFAGLVEGRHLVGAVPSFDEERLRAMYRQFVKPGATRFPWHYHLIDVEALAVGWLSAARNAWTAYEGFEPSLPWKSDDLSAALGIGPPAPGERHTALADARWAKAIYEAVLS